MGLAGPGTPLPGTPGWELDHRDLSRAKENEWDGKGVGCRGKAVWDHSRDYEIIMRNLGEEQVWENKGVSSDWSECGCAIGCLTDQPVHR